MTATTGVAMHAKILAKWITCKYDHALLLLILYYYGLLSNIVLHDSHMYGTSHMGSAAY